MYMNSVNLLNSNIHNYFNSDCQKYVMLMVLYLYNYIGQLHNGFRFFFNLFLKIKSPMTYFLSPNVTSLTEVNCILLRKV